MAGGQGGHYDAGPGTTIYLYNVRAVVTTYGSRGSSRESRNETWHCYFSSGGNWVCGFGE